MLTSGWESCTPGHSHVLGRSACPRAPFVVSGVVGVPHRRWPYCTTPGCSGRAPRGRCRACLARAERARGNPAARGYTSRWRRFSAGYLRRHPWCAWPGCGRVATEVDHIDGLGPNGPRGYDEDSLRPLCHGHHSARTARGQPGGWWAEVRQGGRA